MTSDTTPASAAEAAGALADRPDCSECQARGHAVKAGRDPYTRAIDDLLALADRGDRYAAGMVLLAGETRL